MGLKKKKTFCYFESFVDVSPDEGAEDGRLSIPFPARPGWVPLPGIQQNLLF